MKHILRVLSLMLCICILSASLTSCFFLARFSSMIDRVEFETNDEQPPLEDTDFEIDGDNPLRYSLTDAHAAHFARQLALCESLLLEGSDVAAIEAAMETLEKQYDYVATQSRIAYLLYCCDLTDEKASEDYLFATDMVADIYEGYISLCRKLDESSSPYRETFFSDWTEAELADMRNYSDEATELQRENEELLVAYRALTDEAFMSEAPSYYLQLAENNNAIAELNGYRNYYEYAYERIYLRDYDAQDVAAMRTYVSQVIVPMVKTVYERFQRNFQVLSEAEQHFVINFLEDDYDSFRQNYVQMYLNVVPTDMGMTMKSMLEEGSSVFSDGENAMEGAYTTYLYSTDTPICYFGPGYQSTLTVIHEMGHYYAATFEDGFGLPMDLAELQSQGNEWLMIAYLDEFLSADIYEVLLDYLLYEQLSTVVICVIVDQFEEAVYSTDVSAISAPTFLDSLMRDVCTSYGGTSFVSKYLTDINYYWRAVVLESPVYYISYATSGLAALGLYLKADSDFRASVTAYVEMVKAAPTQGFCEAIEGAGLFSPFKESTYIALRAAFS